MSADERPGEAAAVEAAMWTLARTASIPAQIAKRHAEAVVAAVYPVIAAARTAVPASLAALAASRADNERMTDEQYFNDPRVDELARELTRTQNAFFVVQAERDAARVEVSQLRAKIDAVLRAQSVGTVTDFADALAALAEPLGSTEDPQA